VAASPGAAGVPAVMCTCWSALSALNWSQKKGASHSTTRLAEKLAVTHGTCAAVSHVLYGFPPTGLVSKGRCADAWVASCSARRARRARCGTSILIVGVGELGELRAGADAPAVVMRRWRLLSLRLKLSAGVSPYQIVTDGFIDLVEAV